MEWVKNTEKNKPEIDERYFRHHYSVTVIIHIKMGLNFIGYWDYDENCWYADCMSIDDDNVMFWCKIPKVPSLA